MTATPIPRTLALARYGDLDTSALRELPLGRQPIETRLVTGEEERERAYEHLREELAAGRQAYVVCPLIEEPDAVSPGESGESPPPSSQPDLRAAAAELLRLRRASCGATSWRCCTAGCVRARSRTRWRRSPQGGPTCSWPRP